MLTITTSVYRPSPRTPSRENQHSRSEPARRDPDVTISRSPIQRRRINKIRRSECRQPRRQECDGSRQTERVGPKPLRGQFTARNPGIGGDHAIVADNVHYRQAHDGPSRGDSTRGDGVDDGGQELREPADEHADHEEDAATADVGDDSAVDQDGDDADGGEDA